MAAKGKPERRDGRRVEEPVRKSWQSIPTEEEVDEDDPIWYLGTTDGVQVIIMQGSTVELEVDAIIHCTNSSLDLSEDAVSKAFLKRAGGEIRDQLRGLHPEGIPPGKIVMSEGYLLPCQAVFYGVLPSPSATWEHNDPISSFVFSCLTEAQGKQFTSIAFPHLASFNRRYSRNNVAEQMLLGVFHFLLSNPGASITTVIFVAKTPQGFKSFQSAFRSFRPITVKERRDIWIKKTTEKKRAHYVSGKNVVSAADDSRVFRWPYYYCVHDLNPDLTSQWTIDDELNIKVSLWRGDVTALEIDAIVNAAKPQLRAGKSGVNGAIHNAAGPMLTAECATLGECTVGSAVVTAGYRLPAKYVIHTVGPKQEDPIALATCYSRCLDAAIATGIRSIAFPTLSARAYSHTARRSARVALRSVREFLADRRSEIDQVVFCVFDDDILDAYEQLMPLYFPVESTRYNVYLDSHGQ